MKTRKKCNSSKMPRDKMQHRCLRAKHNTVRTPKDKMSKKNALHPKRPRPIYMHSCYVIKLPLTSLLVENRNCLYVGPFMTHSNSTFVYRGVGRSAKSEQFILKMINFLFKKQTRAEGRGKFDMQPPWQGNSCLRSSPHSHP